jgi:hypothetical protein
LRRAHATTAKEKRGHASLCPPYGSLPYGSLRAHTRQQLRGAKCLRIEPYSSSALARARSLTYSGGRNLLSGDPDLFDDVKATLQRRIRIVPKSRMAHIRDGIILANSIDDFLDVHRHDHRMVAYGKAAIVKCILEAEAGSKLFFDPATQLSRTQPATIDFADNSDTWLVKLMRLLSRGVQHSDRATLFDNCSFVVFNYDRCIEHFFINALQRFYNITPEEAVGIVTKAKIFHPYGTTGELDGAIGTGTRASFGAEHADYCRIGETAIKTYSESVESDQIRIAVTEAQQIVFLGFAYHDQNMNLLAERNSLKPKSIIGTGLGMSPADIQVVKDQIFQWIDPTIQPRMSGAIDIRDNLTAAQIFEFYSKSL